MPNIDATRWVLLGSLNICLPKATVLHQQTQAVCENQPTESHWSAKHLKQCCTQNSERLLQMPVCEKDRLRKIASSSEGAV